MLVVGAVAVPVPGRRVVVLPPGIPTPKEETDPAASVREARVGRKPSRRVACRWPAETSRRIRPGRSLDSRGGEVE